MTDTPKIKHLVISGGGGTGLSYYSVLRESNKDGFWNIDDIETIHGVSIGSYLAFFLTVLKHIGWDAYDDYMIKRPWETIFSAEKLFNAYNNVGICGRETVETICSPILRAIDLPLNTTLQELYEFTGIDLHLYTTNLDSYKYIDLSHKTHPNWSLIDAIYSSSAIPVMFRPNRMNGEVFVDGAFLCNYPIQQCIDQVENPEEIFGINKIYPKPNTGASLEQGTSARESKCSAGVISLESQKQNECQPFDLLGKEITRQDEIEHSDPIEYDKYNRVSTPEYSNIIDYLLDIITKTVKKIAFENTKHKYTIDIVDESTNVWEIYNTIKTKESRFMKMQYGVESWNEFKQQIGFVKYSRIDDQRESRREL